MDREILEKYRSAGRILAEVLEEARQRVEVGAALLDVAEFVEGAIRSRGAQPAFPCNISLDRNAAHYTPSPNDKSVFGENMVKLDVGVHVDGYIADAAITVDLSGHEKLAEASCAGLDAALELVGPGVSTATIGKAIEEAITGYGFKPVSNLTGHGLSRYLAHDEPAVPNKVLDKGTVLKAGDVIAIEPFATNGSGRISESPINEIYGLSAAPAGSAARGKGAFERDSGELQDTSLRAALAERGKGRIRAHAAIAQRSGAQISCALGGRRGSCLPGGAHSCGS